MFILHISFKDTYNMKWPMISKVQSVFRRNSEDNQAEIYRSSIITIYKGVWKFKWLSVSEKSLAFANNPANMQIAYSHGTLGMRFN